MQQQQGPCVCGQSLGKHTRRAARRHRAQWDDLVFEATAVAILSGVGCALFELLHGPKGRGFAGELESAVFEAAHYVKSVEQ